MSGHEHPQAHMQRGTGDESTGPGRWTAGAPPMPPPRGGILWETLGDIRTLLSLPAAFTLQVAHPAVGAGVDDHSAFRTDPWGRSERSLRSMLTWVYGGAAAVEEGRRLRKVHEDIRGTDAHGRPYHALDPATYAWVHATGFPVARRSHRYLHRRPFTAAEEDRLYAEWRQVGRVLGIADADIPPSVAEFWRYYRGVVREELELTVVAAELVDVHAPVPPPDRGPRALQWALRTAWPVLWPPVARFRRFLTIGLLPPDAREALGLPWSPRQERRLYRFGRATAVVVPLLPARLRYLPQARRARSSP